MVWLHECDLKLLGFRHIGKNVKIDSMSIVINPETTSIGDNTRIDAFTFLSGDIVLGSHVHIPIHASLVGTNKIRIGDDCSIGAYSYFVTTNADYTRGTHLIGPTYPPEYKQNNHKGPVVLEDHVVLGAHCTVLPDVYVREGGSFGAYSLLKRWDYFPWSIYRGIPAKFVKSRPKDFILSEWKKIRDFEDSQTI